MRQHKSMLIIEAQLMHETVRHELAVLLYQQAGGIELRLAEDGDDGEDAPTRNDHLVSAASCFVQSGDLAGARKLLEQATLSEKAAAFFARIPALEQTAARSSI